MSNVGEVAAKEWFSKSRFHKKLIGAEAELAAVINSAQPDTQKMRGALKFARAILHKAYEYDDGVLMLWTARQCIERIDAALASVAQKEPAESGEAETPQAREVLNEQTGDAPDRISLMRAALVEIATHWAINYGHKHSSEPMYKGPYGIGVTDGHRACAAIARAGLGLVEGERVPGSGTLVPQSATPEPEKKEVE